MKRARKIPDPPTGLGTTGTEYWTTILTDFDLEPHFLDLLCEACRQLDRSKQAADLLATEGITYRDRFGQVREHPAVSIERNAGLAFCRLQREMGLDLEPASASRPPARPGTRN